MIQPHHSHLINRANELVARQCIERTTMAGRELENMSQELALVCTELVREIEDSSTRISELEGRRKTSRTRPIGRTHTDMTIASIVENHFPICRELIGEIVKQSDDPDVLAEIDDAIRRSTRLSSMTRNIAVSEFVKRRLDVLSRQCILEFIRMPIRTTGWYPCESVEAAAQ